MESRRLVVALALVAGAAWGATSLPRVAAQDEKPKTKLADLAWLAGSWRQADEHGIFDETWLAPEGDAMSAVSRAVDGGKTSFYELSTIEATDAGLVLRIRHFGAGLAPWKSDGETTPSWPLASAGEREAVFEEPTRDFPRKITYRLEPGKDGKPDVLVAELYGEKNGRKGGPSFRLTRVGK